MERRLVHGILIVLTLVALAGGIAALGYRRTRPGGPIASLNEVRARARARRFDEARSLLAGYLQAHPGDRRGHLLMAQLATEPPNPAPELALGELRPAARDNPGSGTPAVLRGQGPVPKGPVRPGGSLLAGGAAVGSARPRSGLGLARPPG